MHEEAREALHTGRKNLNFRFADNSSRTTDVLINDAKLVAIYTLLVIQRVRRTDERSRYRRILNGPTPGIASLG
jgi:hypothetical protein